MLARSVGVLLLVMCAGTAIARAQVPGESIEYYAYDAVGSVRVVFNPSGTVVGRGDYLPFGEELPSNSGLPNERFTGQERDLEAGLDYFVARSYQVRHGRFGQPDPLSGSAMNPQSWNRYAYAFQNPISYTDPSGLQAQGPNFWTQARCTETFTSSQCIDSTGGGGGRGGNPAWIPPEFVGPVVNGPVLGGARGGTLRSVPPPDTPAYNFGFTENVTVAAEPQVISFVDKVHIALNSASVASDVTGVGASWSWAFDVFDGCISLGQGNVGDFGWSMAAAVPMLGTAANLRKIRSLENRHHIFPVQYEARFAKAGINNIHEFGLLLPVNVHHGIHPAWNRAWNDFFFSNPRATMDDIFAQSGRMIEQFGLQGYPTCTARRR